MAWTDASPRRQWAALGLAFVGQWSNSLVTQVLPPLAPLFMVELHLSKSEVGFFSSAGFVGAWGVLLVAGTLADRFGVRRVMSMGQISAGLVMLSMSMVGEYLQAVLVMIGAGISRGIVAPSATKAVADWFPPRVRATAMGIQQSAVPLTGILMASTMPALGLAVGWRIAVSLVGIMIVLDGIIAAVFYLDAPRREQAASAGGSTWAALRTIMRSPNMWSFSAMALLVAGAQLAVTTYVVLFFEESVLVPLIPDKPSRMVAAGSYLAVCQLGGVFARFTWGLLCNRLFRGRRAAVLTVTAALGSITSLALAGLTSNHSQWVMAVVVFAAGAAAMGWAGLYFAQAAEMAGPAHAATSLGLNMTILQFGTVAGAPLFGAALDLSGSYQVAWLLLSGIYTVATLLAFVAMKGESKTASLAWRRSR